MRIATGQARTGDEVFRLTDAAQMKAVREVMNQENVHIPLDMYLHAMPGEKPALKVADSDGHCVEATGNQIVDAAQQRALDETAAMKQLGKLGGTPYTLRHLRLESENAFMTTGMLNALRRDALEKIRKARIELKQTDRLFTSKKCQMPVQEHLLIAQRRFEQSACTAVGGATSLNGSPRFTDWMR
ncbi:MAG: DUF3656 domain-containing protein [Christensenellales bacterium]